MTGVEQVDNLQDGVNNLAAGQVGQGGLLQPVGDHFSREGINRTERQGRDESGAYVSNSAPGGETLNTVVGGVSQGTQNVAGQAVEGVKSGGGLVGGLLGGGQSEQRR